METYAPPLAVPPVSAPPSSEAQPRNLALPLALAGVIAGAAALRFAGLGIQSYHHDEVITAMRVIPGSFAHMLHEVKVSESNPPLYYVLAWVWAKLFGRGEFELRALSALFGTAVVPVAYLVGRRLASRRAGLILAALAAVNPMLIWYSQEARSYALLVFFGALSCYFFLRVLDEARGRDLALWALSSALALCSHYFAAFPVAIEAAWLLVSLRILWRLVLPAVAAVAATGAALLPLLSAQVNATHIGWIEKSRLPTRFLEAGASFLIGETGHVIAEPVRYGYAILPAVAVAAALALLALRGDSRERYGAGIALVLGLGVVALAGLAALVGKDYVVERNLLPALLPLAAVVAVGFSVGSGRRIGAVLAIGLCAYWLAFDAYVTQKPNLQRPDFRALSQAIGPAKAPRAVVSWKLAADPIRWYLPGQVPRMYGGRERVREVDLVVKPHAARRPVNLPPSFRRVQRLRLDRLTLLRYLSRRPVRIDFPQLKALHTGFGEDAVVLNGPAGWHVGPAVRTRSGESAFR
ncbi:MAG TPA: glycosyltransferase family 39 protein [Solirubrobacterales bacterium]|nr:glycosyltransferase family 39 protein [Solirubrobacterales bacterium]